MFEFSGLGLNPKPSVLEIGLTKQLCVVNRVVYGCLHE